MRRYEDKPAYRLLLQSVYRLVVVLWSKLRGKKCLRGKQKQRSIVKKDPIFTLNIPKIRCKTPWNMRWKWVISTQFAGGWGTHSGRDKADVGGMRKMVAQMINSSKIHELIIYSANVLLSTLSPVNMRATLLRFVESWKYREKWRFLLRNFSVE